MTEMSKSIAKAKARRFFGTDGIRGRANAFPMTPDMAMRAAMAAGVALKNGHRNPRVVIGKDTRLSGYMIESALQAGFTAAGWNVFLLGPIPTPAVAMLTRSLRCDMGVMISASHNPYSDNGIKFFAADGYKLSDETELHIEKLIDRDVADHLVESQEIGRAKRIEDAQARYIEFAKRTLPRNMRLDGLRVVIDCAHGAGYKVAPEALWELGAEVVRIGNGPNGLNINKECGSTYPQTLAAKVHEVRADIGIALDGDGDRVIIVDENGGIVDGDQLMAVVAQSWKEDGRLTADGIVATIMSNLGLERYLDTLSLSLARTAVGDRYVVEHMRQNGYNVGGEQSGHIILSDYSTTGDGLVAALQVLAVVQKLQKPVSEVCRRFEPLPQILKNVRFSGQPPLDHDDVVSAISNAEQRLGNSGRLVIRKSGTEPLIRVMGEGEDEDLINQVVGDICETITKVAA